MMGEIFVEYREETNEMMRERIETFFYREGGNRILGAAVVVECSRTKRILWSQEEGNLLLSRQTT
jgi:hypothetical protein